MKKILILSAPHTGTCFARDYLLEVMPITLIPEYNAFVKSLDKNIVCNMHTTSQQRLTNERSINMVHDIAGYAIDNCKVVIPFRHPIKNALSCLMRQHKDLINCTESWRILLEMYLKYDVFWLDVDISEGKRRNMMDQLNAFVECEPINSEKFNSWIEHWEPRNSYSDRNPIKKAYAENGTLPKGYDFNELDFAVQWYDEMKIKLEQQYSMPLPMD